MVTTFSPPAKAKKKAKLNLPVLPIALGAVIVALLAGLIMTNKKLSAERETAVSLTDAVVNTAKAAGLDITAEALADVTNGPIVLASVATVVTERVAELKAARDEVEVVKANVGRLEGEGQTAQQQLTDLRTQMEAARSEAKAKADEVTALQKKSAAEIASRDAIISDLKLTLESTQQEIAEAETAAEEVVVTETVVEPVVAVDASGEAASTNAVAAPVEEAPPARGKQAAVIPEGKSGLFKTVRYDPANSRMVLLTLDEQVITYSDVPQTVYDELMAAPILDIYYRFKIMDMFVSDPKDRDVIRSVGK